jgi:predicted exporter
MIVEAVRSIEARVPPAQRVVGTVSSILDVIPPDQHARLRVLGDIRSLLEDPALEELPPAQQAELRDLRPPPDLRPLTVADLPRSLREPLTERDGRVGLLIAVRPGPHVDQWNGRDLLRLAAAVRSLELASGETMTTSGSSVVFADIIAAIERDGPIVTVLAVVLLIVMVAVVVRGTRAVVAVLAATALGTLAMVAVAAAIGLRVNFLDFVALPITLGLGVDYAVNIAHRAAESAAPPVVLRTSGSTVLVCSLTTVVGYASLLVSENGAIRSFGVPLLIGEITSVIAAFALVPALMFANRIALPVRR